MITAKIIITDTKDGRTAVAFDVDQSQASSQEMKTAAILNLGIEATCELLMSGPDKMIAGTGIGDYVKDFIRKAQKPEPPKE